MLTLFKKYVDNFSGIEVHSTDKNRLVKNLINSRTSKM